ncbi:HNH endonuclease [Mycobacterium phage EleanorGeorge]|uniref:Uncharacterized protein n=1 Tax=Mycobacterium phage EleanorGeorge TaxID=2301563 RepID=A0A385DQ14_9CAUD|nr:HNH endonuclease [Mycobacterium phage EleanorGeorge]AXQ60772.1 hypothetical protein SEA_ELEANORGEORGE_72 [Mycobacterium phage EleanorGeorge]
MSVKITTDIAELDIEEFEFLIRSGETVEQAVHRMGMSARTIARRYEYLGRSCPPGLYWLCSGTYRKRRTA